jgi:hypothetical protein
MAAFEKVEQRNIQNKQQWYITKRISDRNMIYLLTMMFSIGYMTIWCHLAYNSFLLISSQKQYTTHII